MISAFSQPTEQFDETSQLEELSLLFKIGKLINSTLTLPSMLNSILELTIKLFQARAGSIMLLDKDNYLTVKAAVGLTQETVKITRIKLGDGISGQVAKTGQPLLLIGKAREPQFKNLVKRKEEIRSSLCVPLKIKERSIGVINIREALANDTFTTRQLHLLSAVADQIALAIHNSQLYHTEKQKAAELSNLNKVIIREKDKIEDILEQMADGVIVTNKKGKIILLNKVAKCFCAPLLDNNPLGKDFKDIFAVHPEFSELHAKIMETGENLSLELRLNNLVLNARAVSLKDKSEQITGMVSILEDITQMKRINEIKTDFVALLSHELKTPLTSILGFIEILKFNKEEPLLNQSLGIIEEEASHLLRLINNLLDLSKLETGKIEFDKSVVDLNELINNALKFVPGLSSKHQLTVQTFCLQALVKVNPDLIYQVINILVSNAIKFSPAGSQVNIALKEDDTNFVVSITDSGTGIKKEDLPNLFKKFHRLDPKFTGTGLGLSNAKYIIECHNGNIKAESKEGEGTTFTFSLPKIDAPARKDN